METNGTLLYEKIDAEPNGINEEHILEQNTNIVLEQETIINQEIFAPPDTKEVQIK
jgi:hypothetical protein